jgi:hypothetical protein
MSEVNLKICPWLVGEIRSDHAGETGAIWFYRGVLAVTRDAEVRDFAERHIETEMKHLELLEGWLVEPERTSLLSRWKVGGYFWCSTCFIRSDIHIFNSGGGRSVRSTPLWSTDHDTL